MSGVSILIVDDNLINLKLISVLLAIEGYDVHTATNANEALKLLNNLIPTIILMDIQLPGMDGLQLTKQLRLSPQYQETIILAVSAYAMKGDKEKALKAGCDGYITKPIDTKVLPQLIVEYLKIHGNVT